MTCIIGIRWKEEFIEKLYTDVVVSNPDYKADHWSCAHVAKLTAEEQLKKMNDYCMVCGRKVKMISHKKQITVKKLFPWVINFDPQDIRSLVLLNPFTFNEYRIIANKNNSKQWICCVSLTDYNELELEAEEIISFQSFMKKFFNVSGISLIFVDSL